MTAKDTLRPQDFPDRCLVGCQGLKRLGRLVRQITGVRVVDRQAFGRALVRCGRRAGRRCMAASAPFCTERRCSAKAFSEAAPTSNAPRNGALQEDSIWEVLAISFEFIIPSFVGATIRHCPVYPLLVSCKELWSFAG